MYKRQAYSYGATETPTANNQVAVNPSEKSSWQPTRTSSNGLPVFSANFSGQPLANSVSETMQTSVGGTPVSQVQNYITELDFGLKNIGNPAWNNPTAVSYTHLDVYKRQAESVAAGLAALCASFSRYLRQGARMLPDDFWRSQPPVIRLFSGYLHMHMQNDDYSPKAWSMALESLEEISALFMNHS